MGIQLECLGLVLQNKATVQVRPPTGLVIEERRLAGVSQTMVYATARDLRPRSRKAYFLKAPSRGLGANAVGPNFARNSLRFFVFAPPLSCSTRAFAVAPKC